MYLVQVRVPGTVPTLISRSRSTDTMHTATYHLLVFREGTILENHIFSDDHTQVNEDINDMAKTIKDDDGNEVLVSGTAVNWRVVLSGGARFGSARKKKTRKLFSFA